MSSIEDTKVVVTLSTRVRTKPFVVQIEKAVYSPIIVIVSNDIEKDEVLNRNINKEIQDSKVIDRTAMNVALKVDITEDGHFSILAVVYDIPVGEGETVKVIILENENQVQVSVGIENDFGIEADMTVIVKKV